jgi:DNA-binding winged helix-turn-helix (wHTH) protein/Tol biopolymer transport system component
MSSPAQGSGRVSFGEFELNLETAELQRNGSKSILPGKPFQILITLLDRPGQLVTREELKRQLWPSDTFVDFDVNLNKAVNRLREALGDSAEHPRFIETLPRKGYRFVGEVGNGASGNASKTSADLMAPSPQPAPDAGALDKESTAEAIRGTRAHSSRFKYVLVTAITIGIAAVVAAMLFKRFAVPRSPDLLSVHITKLTDNGMAKDVAISGDGRYIVYSLANGEQESLRLRQIATGSDIEVLPPGPGFHGLTFSPDGIKVYFVRSDPNDPHFKYLYSVSVLGGSPRQMIADADSPVSFSPDGSQFVFERAVVSRNVIELRIANADGNGEHVLATIPKGDAGLFQPGPSWSESGRVIVCPVKILDQQVRWILVSISVPEGSVREFYSDEAALGRPVWLSEEQLLLPRYEPEYRRSQLWTISYRSGKARRFTNDLTDYDQPLGIARDRKTVVAVATTAVSNIWRARADNLSSWSQITSGELPMFHVAETAGGRLFSSGGGGKIWTINSNGKRESFGDFQNTAWLEACNSFILFTSTEGKTVTLTRVNEDGSHLMKLFGGDVSRLGCSPDGKYAYYVNRHRPQKMWRISTDGGDPREIGLGMGESISSPLSISPDGKFLAYTFVRYRPNASKMGVQLASGGPLIKIFDVPGGTYRIRWAPAGTSLQYLVTENGVTNVWEQPLAGGNAKQLTKFNSGRIFDFTWSSDHQTLFFTRGDETSDVVMFSNVR